MNADGYTFVVIDQKKHTVGTRPRYAWFPKGSKPTVTVSASRKADHLFGAVTEHRETLFRPQDRHFTGATTIRFLKDLVRCYGEKLAVVLDRAPYFRSKAVQTFAREHELELIYLPRYSPDMNPMEECWRQLEQQLANHCFSDVYELRTAIIDALPTLSAPPITPYLQN